MSISYDIEKHCVIFALHVSRQQWNTGVAFAYYARVLRSAVYVRIIISTICFFFALKLSRHGSTCRRPSAGRGLLRDGRGPTSRVRSAYVACPAAL